MLICLTIILWQTYIGYGQQRLYIGDCGKKRETKSRNDVVVWGCVETGDVWMSVLFVVDGIWGMRISNTTSDKFAPGGHTNCLFDSGIVQRRDRIPSHDSR